MALSDELTALLRTPALCYMATTMPDGSPQLTQTWVDTDGEHIVVNIVEGMQKAREGGVDSIEALSQKYTGGPYAWYGGRDQVRLLVKIDAQHVSGTR